MRAADHDPLHMPTLWHLGDLSKKQGSLDEAGQWAAKAPHLSEKLAASDPRNAQWQIDLVVSWVRMGGSAPTVERKRAWYVKALHVLQSLDQRGALTAAQIAWMPWIENQIQHGAGVGVDETGAQDGE